MTSKQKVRYQLLPLFLIPLGFFLYIDALRAPFVYDDKGFIVQNEAIRSLSNFFDLSGTRYLGFLSFALNYSIGGLTAFDYHLTNLIIHIANSVILFFLIVSVADTPLLKQRAEKKAVICIAFVVSTVFLSHPIETQAVTYVTQRFTSLATMFYLLAVFSYSRARIMSASGKRGLTMAAFYVLSLLSTIAAMKTKEISFTIPFAILLYDWTFFPSSRRAPGSWMRVPFYFTLLIIPLTILAPESMGTVKEGLRELQLKEAAMIDRNVYVITQFRVIVTYIRLLFYPAGQSIDYGYPISRSIFEPSALVSMLFLAALFFSSLYCLYVSRKRSSLYGVLFSFGVLWFFNALTVESFLVPIQDVIFEHRVYLPSAGFFIAAAAALFYMAEKLRASTGIRLPHPVAAAIVLVLACPPLFAATLARNKVWTDERLLLDEAVLKSPGKARLRYARAQMHFDRKEYAQAVYEATAAIGINPFLADSFHVRGMAYQALGRHDDSIKDFSKAVLLDPGVAARYYNRAVAYDAGGEYDKAISDYAKALGIRGDFADAYNNRGGDYFRTGDRDGAIRDFEKACSLNHTGACNNLETLRKAKKERSGDEKKISRAGFGFPSPMGGYGRPRFRPCRRGA